MDGSKFTDTANFTGIWFMLHTLACNATTEELKWAFEININDMCEKFRCLECKKHFRKYLDENPFYKYWNIKDIDGNDIGFYKWTWEFHNAVNAHLKKKKVPLEESYIYYKNVVGICTECNKH